MVDPQSCKIPHDQTLSDPRNGQDYQRNKRTNSATNWGEEETWLQEARRKKRDFEFSPEGKDHSKVIFSEARAKLGHKKPVAMPIFSAAQENLKPR